MAEAVTRSGHVELRSKEPLTQATKRHCSLMVRRGRFSCALLMLAASVSVCGVAQTARPKVASGPGGGATQVLFPLTLRGAGETSALKNGVAVENAANTRRVIVIGFVGGFARQDDPGILKCSLPNIFETVIAPRCMPRCLEIMMGEGPFMKSCISSTAMETAIHRRPNEKSQESSSTDIAGVRRKQWSLLESWKSRAFRFSSPSRWTASQNRAVTIRRSRQTWQMPSTSISRAGRFRDSQRSSQPTRLKRRSSVTYK